MVIQSLFLLPFSSVVKMVEADCVRAILASFVGVARQGGGATECAVEHLKLLLKLAPKGGIALPIALSYVTLIDILYVTQYVCMYI